MAYIGQRYWPWGGGIQFNRGFSNLSLMVFSSGRSSLMQLRLRCRLWCYPLAITAEGASCHEYTQRERYIAKKLISLTFFQILKDFCIIIHCMSALSLSIEPTNLVIPTTRRYTAFQTQPYPHYTYFSSWSLIQDLRHSVREIAPESPIEQLWRLR